VIERASIVAEKSDAELANLIANYERHRRINDPRYLEALAERDRRRSAGLSFDRSKQVIATAARAGKFVSYKQLADASGVSWQRAHFPIFNHLWDLSVWSHGKFGILLSAVVVNEPNRETGEKDPDALNGFIRGAIEIGLDVGQDHEAFLRQQQHRVFEWARSEAA
jgi:hypothetical protein